MHTGCPPRSNADHDERPVQGINVTSLREIKLLKELKCPHVVELLDVFPYKKRVSMVRPLAESSSSSSSSSSSKQNHP
jgi:hypothetical protein